MTRDRKIAEAQQMRAAGSTYQAIADRFEVSNACAYKWVNRDKSREYNRRTNAKPARRIAKARWGRDNRAVCECGQPMVRAATRCYDCLQRELDLARAERWSLTKKLWDDGVPLAEMAVRLGKSCDVAVGVEMAWMRRCGWDLPYRRAGWEGHARKVGAPRKLARTNQQARQRLKAAIRSGRVVKPDRCERCGAATHLDGHHHDYSKPLEVEWLCRPCHAVQHGATELEEAA